MPGFPRDLADPAHWQTSLARSQSRRKQPKRTSLSDSSRQLKSADGSSLRLASLIDARNRLPSPRDLSGREPWELSLLRSRTRRRAVELQFVPTATRARRVSLGTLIAIAAGPASGLADAHGKARQATPPTPEPPTTASHHLLLQSGSEGRQVLLLQRALGVTADGVFGPETEAAVRAFQASHGLEVDGVVGPQTSAALSGPMGGAPSEQTFGARPASAGPAASSASLKEAVASGGETAAARGEAGEAQTGASATATNPLVRLQEALHVQVDGTFGSETEAAVRRLQARHNLNVDGVVGPETWSALGLRESVTLHSPRAPHRHSHSPARARHVSAHASSVDGAVGVGDGEGGEGGGDTGGGTGDGGSAVSGERGGESQSTRHRASAGDPITRLQEALHVQVDGTFGSETEAAVRRLQARHNLNVDGVVGPETWSALGLRESVTLHPPHHAHARAHGEGAGTGASSSAGGGEGVVARVTAAADEIATRPYVYGGGHGSFQSTGYDCSGSVSYALHGGGLLSSPEDSSELESYGEPGPGRHITIYANSEHAWMVIDGRRFDTVAQQETGTRWSDSMASTAGYVVRHPAGL